MTKGKKNYKKLVKLAFMDKVKNTVILMKFLHAKGGINLVQEYFAEALPGYVLEYDRMGDAQRWVLRQLAKKTPHAFMKQVTEQAQKDTEFMTPRENFEILEDTKEQLAVSVKCEFLKQVLKEAKKYECDFDVREYYCKNACIPLLSKGYADIYMDLDIKLQDAGCIQTIRVDHEKLKGEDG